MYVYGFNKILPASMKKSSDKENLCVFAELTTDLKAHRLNTIFHIMDNEDSIGLKKTMKIMDIKYSSQHGIRA